MRLRNGGRYRAEGTLVLNQKHNLNFDGNGARIVVTTLGTPDRSHLRVVDSSHIVIHDLEIAGDNPYGGPQDAPNRSDLGFQHGIRLEGATDVEISRVNIHDVFGDFVYLGNSAVGWTERVWIHNSVFARSGRQGITVTAGRDVVIEHNILTDTRRSNFDLEPNGPAQGADNIHIIDNNVGPGRLLFLAADGLGPVNHVVVARNFLHSRNLSMEIRPPGDTRRTGFWVVGNKSAAGGKSPIGEFDRLDGLVVANNKQPITRAGVPTVIANGVCGLVVSGNDVSPSTQVVTGNHPPCGAGPPIQPPAPPAVAGRPVSAAGPAPTTTTTKPRPATTPSTRLELQSASGSTGIAWSHWARVALAIVVGGSAAALLITWVVLSERRSRRSGDRRRPRRPPRR